MIANISPFISVIMPVFNAEQYISSAIESVLNQDMADWELIIVNDGSSDNSKEIIGYFKDSRIRYFEQPNKGVSAARNLGLQNMNGTFFCFLDADDCLTEKSLSSRLGVFKKSPRINFVDGTIEIFDQNLETLIRTRRCTIMGKPFNYLIDMNPGIFFGPTWMIKRDNSFQYNFNEQMKYLEDIYFYLQISNQGEYSFTRDSILKYRTHSQSAMRNLDGIANGYSQLVSHVFADFSTRLSIFQKITFVLRIRKIMMLSFFNDRSYKKGFEYFFRGTLN
jgi:teichuronic acid biosynthesis glycosyltransferase TuaG